MHNNLVWYSSLIRLAALALLVTSFSHPLTRASATVSNVAVEHVDLYKNIWVNPGLARGQTLRYTWANLADVDPRKREFEPVSIRVRLLTGNGSVIAEREAATVGAGKFQFFDFNRDQISLPGESPTGRLQTVLEATITGNTDVRGNMPNRGILETFVDSIEVIDNTAGRTFLNPRSFQIISPGKKYLIGIAANQTLRVSSLNPPEPAGEGEVEPKITPSFSVRLLLADGSVVAESDEVNVEPGKLHFFDFKRADLPVAGESDARLQVLAQVIWTKVKLKAEFPTLIEVVELSSGKTTASTSQKPKEIVVVGSKCC